MKKIINGRKYDTDTAKRIGARESGRVNDFGHIYEALYQKHTGEFFLHGEGGARTKYAKNNGSLYYDGEDIIPMSVDEAKMFVEQYLDAETYEATFGEVDE